MKEVYSNPQKKEIKEGTLLRTEELAEILNVSKQTIRRWHYIGFLRGMKIGKHLVRYRWGDVQTWVAERQYTLH